MTQPGCLRKFISSRSGTTLLETVVALLIASAIMLGLGRVFILGIKSWRETRTKILLHENGAAGIEHISKAIQNAVAVTAGESGEITVSNAATGSVAVFKETRQTLTKNGTPIIPRDEWDRHTIVEKFGVKKDTTAGIYRISLCLASLDKNTKIKDKMRFESSAFARNEWIAGASQLPGANEPSE